MRTLRHPAFATFIALLAGCALQQRPIATPPPAAELAPDDCLGVGDEFEIRVFQEADLSGLYQIADDGTIDYPLVGRVTVMGLRAGQLQQKVATDLRTKGFVRNPQVSVTVKAWNSRKILVLGQVSKPGRVSYMPNMTIVDALAAAGGFTPLAAKNKVKLRREMGGVVQTSEYPVQDITEGRATNVSVRPDDVIVVDERLF